MDSVVGVVAVVGGSGAGAGVHVPVLLHKRVAEDQYASTAHGIKYGVGIPEEHQQNFVQSAGYSYLP